MSGRPQCDDCGFGFREESLTVRGGRSLCPRCYALAAPAGRPPEPVAPAPTPAVPDPGPGAGSRGRDRLEALRAEVRAWAAGRHWWIRAPLLAWLILILIGYWDDPTHTTIFQGIDLAFHEMGHILWAPFGEFMAMAGGTLTQVLIPVAAGAVLYRQRDWFGVAFAVSWVGINCFEVVPYAGDAVARRLPLVSPTTAEPIHDWGYLLGRLGLLQHTGAVAGAWQWAGRFFMMAGIAFGGWILWIMARSGETAADEPGLTAEEQRFLETLGR